MKNLFLSLLAIFLTAGTISATTFSNTHKKGLYEYIEPSTFCKLIRTGNYEAVKAMIENGTDINRKSTGLTPLMFAARYNKTDIVKLLINKGAKLKVKSDKGFTALQYAKMSKAHDSYSVIKEALEKK